MVSSHAHSPGVRRRLAQPRHGRVHARSTSPNERVARQQVARHIRTLWRHAKANGIALVDVSVEGRWRASGGAARRQLQEDLFVAVARYHAASLSEEIRKGLHPTRLAHGRRQGNHPRLRKVTP
jgi:hypothetical protein